MKRIEATAKDDPARARELLAAVMAPANLTPGPDGCEIALTLRHETAALASGRPMLEQSCGGRI